MAGVRRHPSEGTKHCRDHCGACGVHFRSTMAFDKHRTGSFPKGTRRCRPPEQSKRAGGERFLSILTERGVCDLAHGPRQKSVTIWKMATDDDD